MISKCTIILHQIGKRKNNSTNSALFLSTFVMVYLLFTGIFKVMLIIWIELRLTLLITHQVQAIETLFTIARFLNQTDFNDTIGALTRILKCMGKLLLLYTIQTRFKVYQQLYSKAPQMIQPLRLMLTGSMNNQDRMQYSTKNTSSITLVL